MPPEIKFVLPSFIHSYEFNQFIYKFYRAIAGFTAEFAKIYCPDRLHPLIGGFIMLRFELN